jgi:hypothetical protein
MAGCPNCFGLTDPALRPNGKPYVHCCELCAKGLVGHTQACLSRQLALQPGFLQPGFQQLGFPQPAPRQPAPKARVQCHHSNGCVRSHCAYGHSIEWVHWSRATNKARQAIPPLARPPRAQDCRYGNNCEDLFCKHGHTRDWLYCRKNALRHHPNYCPNEKARGQCNGLGCGWIHLPQ